MASLFRFHLAERAVSWCISAGCLIQDAWTGEHGYIDVFGAELQRFWRTISIATIDTAETKK